MTLGAHTSVTTGYSLGSRSSSCTIVLSREHNRARYQYLPPGALPRKTLTDRPTDRPPDVGRHPARDRDDPHGARSRAGFLRSSRRQSHQSRADHRSTVSDALDHPHLRADVLPADRHRSLSRAKPQVGSELSRFLLIRGVWLILLELTVIRCLGFQFNFDYQVTLLVVIWALGWAMVVLAGLVWLPMPASSRSAW